MAEVVMRFNGSAVADVVINSQCCDSGVCGAMERRKLFASI